MKTAGQRHRDAAIEKFVLAFKATTDAQRAALLEEALDEHACAVAEQVKSDIEHRRVKIP